MKRQKQESILSAFSRQKKPLVKRAKPTATELHGATTFSRDFRAIGSLEAEKFDGNQEHDGDADDDSDGSVTDVDMLSSQEDAVDGRQRSLRHQTTDRVVALAVDASQASRHEIAISPEFPCSPTDKLLHETKDVKDSVHGILSFEPLCWRIIDTLQFQRLRNLHQLGAAATVYIGATHTRFEHCLGVAYLAEKMIGSIHASQPYLGITPRDVLCIKIAGLCHDLGHGPFSHVFDGIYRKQLLRRQPFVDERDATWTHEQGSLDMFDHLLRVNGIDVTKYGLKEIDVVFIKELIFGGPLPGNLTGELRGRPRADQQFLYDFVNNAHSGLDVDKLDYFMRDARHTGAKACCDVDILIRNARVLPDRDDPQQRLSICFPEKLADQVMQAFRTRFQLHQTVYQHKHIRAAEYMLCDALLAGDDHICIKNRRISEIVRHVDAYQHLDDRILARIEESDSEELREAREIRMRMLTRNCYDCIGSTSVTNYSKKLSEERVLTEILNCSPEGRNLIEHHRNDVILEFVRVHFGKGAEDPLQYVRFYAKNSHGSSKCYRLRAESYEMHMPHTFQDSSIRVFVKRKDLFRPVREVFGVWSETYNGSRVRPRNVDEVE